MDGLEFLVEMLGEAAGGLSGGAVISSSDKKENENSGCGCFILVVLLLALVMFLFIYFPRPDKPVINKPTYIQVMVTGKFQNDQLGVHIRESDKDTLVTVSHDLYINKEVNDYVDIKIK